MPCELRHKLQSEFDPYDPDSDFFKCLTVMQPFASLIATGKKKIAVSAWDTKYRGPLVIHAGAKIHRGGALIAGSMQVSAKLMAEMNPKVYLLGVTICMVDLVDVRPMVFNDERDAMQELVEGAFSWIVSNPRALRPKKSKGQMGLWNIESKYVKLDFK